MIVYSVQCKVITESAISWEKYFLEEHLDDVLNTGCFTGYNFKKEINEENDAVLFISEYFCSSLEVLEKYNLDFAPALKKDILDKFSGKYTAKRSLYHLLIKK